MSSLKREIDTLHELVSVVDIRNLELDEFFEFFQEQLTAELRAQIEDTKNGVGLEEHDEGLMKLQLENTKLKHRLAVLQNVSLFSECCL